jgi:hypothetical protein
MAERNILPWRTVGEVVASEELSSRSDQLRRSLIAKTVDVNMTIKLEMGERAVEYLIDEVWDSTRALALNPDTVDVVLDLLFEAIAPEAGEAFAALLIELWSPDDE